MDRDIIQSRDEARLEWRHRIFAKDDPEGAFGVDFVRPNTIRDGIHDELECLIPLVRDFRRKS
jgi:hypothetical protein